MFALFLMLFLTLISFSLVMLISHETKSSSKLHLSQQALYAAEAGVERKIAQLKEEIPGDIGVTDFFGAQYEVAVNSLGADRSEIESTGYVPSKTNFREKRKLSVVVYVSQAVPEHALALGGSGVISSNVTIYGTIRSNNRITTGSNVTITESSAGKGDASIYTSYNGPLTPAIDIGSNFHVSVPGQYIKSRLDSGSSPDTHAPLTSDNGASPIYDENKIVEKYNVTIVENDDSSDTEPVTIPSVDIDSLIAAADFVYDRNNPPPDPPWDWDAGNGYFDYTAGAWDMGGQTFNFKEGVRFNSNINITGPGTIIVSSGTAEYGIELNSNIEGTLNGDYAYMNIIVSGGTWEEDDLRIRSNIKIQGYIYASSSATINSNVDILGIFEAGGESDIASNITVTHSNDIGMDLPWGEGSSGEVEIISWQEVDP
ncbi:pilus assembly PilX N-terminal domain-containing protein [bacterium]|nr:hypothetical protein [Candidatus Omnitrophota bacterium]MBU3929805.1 pilus assembly PilX N-terminal domain-containing protein [bacterium]MBU4122604.1 pilus assembly PilX N-terminal domain-containing protein [bacterium]